MKKLKTNAMRLLETVKVPYEMISYDTSDGRIDGLSVAEKIKRDPAKVYKTLVTISTTKKIIVCVIPVEAELDLKKAAKEMGEKKLEMLPVADLLKVTGYIRGGCSPIGMKIVYPTLLDQTAMDLDTLIVSAGKIGYQIEITPSNFQKALPTLVTDIRK